MRAVRRTEAGIETVDVPAPAAGGVTVRVRSAGICGTDLSMVGSGPLPVVLGHEIAGVLDDGRAVTVDPTAPCGECDPCIAGRAHLCRTAPARTLGIGVDGGMAETVRVDERALVPLAPGVRAEDACIVEPLAVAVHGLRLAGMDGGKRVAIVGAGTIGLCAVACATAAGCHVGVAARHGHQARAGERLGAHAADGEYDIVVDAAGSESALTRVAELTRPGATVVELSTHWGLVPVPGLPALLKELRVLWSYTYGAHATGRDLDDAAALLADRPEIADVLVTHRFPIDDAAEAFRVAADRASGAIKVVIQP